MKGRDVQEEANTTPISKNLTELLSKTTIKFFPPKEASALSAGEALVSDTSLLTITIKTGTYAGCYALVATEDWPSLWMTLQTLEEQSDT